MSIPLVTGFYAGLLGLNEAAMDQYCALTPPLPTVGEPMTFLQSSQRARQWLAADVLGARSCSDTSEACCQLGEGRTMVYSVRSSATATRTA